MKKIGVLNYHISETISKMGHNDMIAIGDAGLPIPDETQRIDISLVKDIPGFIDTLKAVLTELKIDEVIIAQETEEVSPKIYEQIKSEVGDVRINIVSHEQLKIMLKRCKAVIRTGEYTPYANVILKSGVVF